MDIESEVMACMNDMLDIVVKKEEKRLRYKQYYEENKQKISQQHKQYYQENKQEISQKQKEYHKQNREKSLQQQKEWYQKNKEKIKEYQNRPEYVKARRIKDWKYMGVICDNFDALYNHYLKTSYCDFCKCELTCCTIKSATTKCLDHDHAITDRPNFRNILCNSCNLKRR